jgi:hypothetical protein
MSRVPCKFGGGPLITRLTSGSAPSGCSRTSLREEPRGIDPPSDRSATRSTISRGRDRHWNVPTELIKANGNIPPIEEEACLLLSIHRASPRPDTSGGFNHWVPLGCVSPRS